MYSPRELGALVCVIVTSVAGSAEIFMFRFTVVPPSATKKHRAALDQFTGRANHGGKTRDTRSRSNSTELTDVAVGGFGEGRALVDLNRGGGDSCVAVLIRAANRVRKRVATRRRCQGEARATS